MSLVASIIVPVYNDAQNINVCLEALLHQTYSKNNFEVIVADNGSNDDTQNTVKWYCRNYRQFIHMVIEDEIQSSYAAGLRALKRENATCGAGHISFFFESDQPNVYEYFDSKRKLNQKAFVQSAGFGATANFFSTRRLFETYGLFRNDLISGGDYEFGRRLTQKNEKLIYIPDAIVKHPARSTFSKIRKKSKRIAIGQKKLEQLGLLAHGRISWRNWLPQLDCLKAKDLTFLKKIHLLFLANYLQCVNLFRRIL
jgi:GT2 family glycosyltransferase